MSSAAALFSCGFAHASKRVKSAAIANTLRSPSKSDSTDTASDAGDNAIAGLLLELNHTQTIFPGTSLRMVYELSGNTADPDLSGSGM